MVVVAAIIEALNGASLVVAVVQQRIRKEFFDNFVGCFEESRRVALDLFTGIEQVTEFEKRSEAMRNVVAEDSRGIGGSGGFFDLEGSGSKTAANMVSICFPLLSAVENLLAWSPTIVW